MKTSRLRFLLLWTFATFLSAGAQVNGGKPVLSVPPSPRPEPAAPPSTSMPTTGQPGMSGSSQPAVSGTDSSGTPVGPQGAQGTAPGDANALPAPGSGEVPPTYVIGPDDSIAVSVWKEPSLSGTLPVRPDGMISLALVGDLRAAGFTPMQLAQDIAGRLKKFVNDPNVTVTVTGVNSKRIYMLGEIGHVGPLPLTAGLTPLEAIATAGGIQPFANGKHIYILRTVSGKQVKIPFDYKKAIKTGDQQGVTLLPGDKIVVP